MAVSDNAVGLMVGLSLSTLGYVAMLWYILYKVPKKHGLVSSSRKIKTVILPALDEVGLLCQSECGEFDLEKEEPSITKSFLSSGHGEKDDILTDAMDDYFEDRDSIQKEGIDFKPVTRFRQRGSMLLNT